MVCEIGASSCRRRKLILIWTGPVETDAIFCKVSAYFGKANLMKATSTGVFWVVMDSNAGEILVHYK